MRFRALLALGIIVFGACPVMAQPKQRYVPFPFDLNAEALVQDRLNQLKDLHHAQDFIEKLLRDSKKLNLDDKTREMLKKLNLNDPRVQDQLKPWMDKSVDGKLPVAPKELPKFEEVIKKVAEDQQTPAPAPPTGPAPTPADLSSPPESPPVADSEAEVRGWLENTMERAEESNLGKWLHDSSAFRTALQELHGSARLPDLEPGAWGLDRFIKLDKLPMPDASTLERLGRYKPDLSHIDPPSLPAFSRPSLPPVSAPPTPSMSSLGTLATWLLSLALIALLVWQVSRWIDLPGRAPREAADAIGPWPVQPSEVATRADLVKAFDHLALLLLGAKARTWHHRAIAEAIVQRAAAHTGSAVQLAALYEQARYTPGAETLAADDRDQARAALVRLAGVAA